MMTSVILDFNNAQPEMMQVRTLGVSNLNSIKQYYQKLKYPPHPLFWKKNSAFLNLKVKVTLQMRLNS